MRRYVSLLERRSVWSSRCQDGGDGPPAASHLIHVQAPYTHSPLLASRLPEHSLTRSAKLIGALVGLFVLGSTVTGCGDRVRVAHRVTVAFHFSHLRGVEEIESRLDEGLLERLGGSLPDIWPEDEPPVVIRAPMDIAVLVERPSLAGIGEDLERVAGDDFELRLRAVDWSLLLEGPLHPIESVEIWVGPEDAEHPGAPGVSLVGYVDPPTNPSEHMSGNVSFAPGGRRALKDHLLEEQFVLLLRAMLLFDSDRVPERPEGGARLELVFQLDILR